MFAVCSDSVVTSTARTPFHPVSPCGEVDLDTNVQARLEVRIDGERIQARLPCFAWQDLAYRCGDDVCVTLPDVEVEMVRPSGMLIVDDPTWAQEVVDWTQRP